MGAREDHIFIGTDIIHAIKAIKADANVSVKGDTVAGIKWHDNNPTNITDEAILAKQVELIAEFDARQYKRDRAAAPRKGGYPETEDQLDMMWHDKKDGTTTWEDAVQAIKDAHPKP
tara:strand:- start:158 stop:508 length:351 start_codon:yes stop_codon:yes gene_type:complete